jgi:hypothetical protein
MTKKSKKMLGDQYVIAEQAKPVTVVDTISPELAESIIQWITNGKTLRDWCRLPGHPHWTTVTRHMERDKEFSVRYRQARVAGMDAIAEDTISMVDEYPERIQGDRIDPGWVQWRRIQIEQRLKLLAKWDPKRYGDKVGLDHSGDISLIVSTGVPNDTPEITE